MGESLEQIMHEMTETGERDVVFLITYLAHEIDKKLNEMKTGNHAQEINRQFDKFCGR